MFVYHCVLSQIPMADFHPNQRRRIHMHMGALNQMVFCIFYFLAGLCLGLFVSLVSVSMRMFYWFIFDRRPQLTLFRQWTPKCKLKTKRAFLSMRCVWHTIRHLFHPRVFYCRKTNLIKKLAPRKIAPSISTKHKNRKKQRRKYWWTLCAVENRCRLPLLLLPKKTIICLLLVGIRRLAFIIGSLSPSVPTTIVHVYSRIQW